MYTHIVVFKVPQPAHRHEMKTRLLAMQGRIESLRSVEVGINELQGDDDFHVVLTTRFDDRTGLEAYRVHPIHQDVVAYIGQVSTERRAIDYS